MPNEERPADDPSPDTDRVEIKSKDEALGFLFEGLAKANRLFVEEKDAGRRGVVEALNVVTEFLLFFQGTTDHRQPLTALLNAVMSLRRQAAKSPSRACIRRHLWRPTGGLRLLDHEHIGLTSASGYRSNLVLHSFYSMDRRT
jgi:hypothetical protein